MRFYRWVVWETKAHSSNGSQFQLASQLASQSQQSPRVPQFYLHSNPQTFGVWGPRKQPVCSFVERRYRNAPFASSYSARVLMDEPRSWGQCDNEQRKVIEQNSLIARCYACESMPRDDDSVGYISGVGDGGFDSCHGDVREGNSTKCKTDVKLYLNYINVKIKSVLALGSFRVAA